MTDDSKDAMPRHPNYLKTRPKHVLLTHEGREAIQAWADREGVSFSAAIETLARLGLGQDPHDAWGPALSAKVIRAVREDVSRIVGLFAAVAIDAGVAARLAGAAVKKLRPAEYHRIKQIARQETVALLRQRDARAELGLLDGQDGPTGDADADEETPTPTAVGVLGNGPPGRNGHPRPHA